MSAGVTIAAPGSLRLLPSIVYSDLSDTLTPPWYSSYAPRDVPQLPPSPSSPPPATGVSPMTATAAVSKSTLRPPEVARR